MKICDLESSMILKPTTMTLWFTCRFAITDKRKKGNDEENRYYVEWKALAWAEDVAYEFSSLYNPFDSSLIF
jgi:hypothetical protein